MGEDWCGWCAGGGHGSLVDGDGTICTDLTGSDALLAVTEDVALLSIISWLNVQRFGGEDAYRYQIDPTQDKDDDARSNQDSPHRQAERLLAGRLLVEIAEHIDTQDQHHESERDETMDWTEQRPVAGVVVAEE